MAIQSQEFYSMSATSTTMAQAVVEGATQVPGAEGSLYQVQELIPDDGLEKSGQSAKVAFDQSARGYSGPRLAESECDYFRKPRVPETWLRRCGNFLGPERRMC